MNLDFLKNFGQMIGGGIKKGIGRLGEMEGADGEAALPMLKRPMPMTPGFNPEASMPSLKAPMMGGDSGTIGHDPRLRNPLPQLQRPDAPAMPTMRGSVDVEGQLPGGQIGVTPQQPQMLAPRPSEVRPPNFMGRKGATMDDTPLNHERYAYDNQYMKDGHHGRRWQDIAMTALHGANEGFKATGDWRGALAGAGTGAAGAVIDPLAARDLRFEREQLPGLERSRADFERGQDRSFEMQKRDADMRGLEARTAATIAGTKDAELVRRQQEAGIAKTEAQTEALKRGTMIQRDVKDADGVIRTYNFFPGKEPQLVGESAKAAMNTQNNEARGKMNTERIQGSMARTVQQGEDAFKRTQAQQSGANWRTGQTQSGQDRRQKDRLGAQYDDVYTPPRTPMGPDIPPQTKAPAVGSVPTKRATAQHVQEYAQKFGVSPEEARKRFEAKGYRVE